ncbi:uncharacterized protein I206_104862 [Kwoniella pini CBS 10737]|uniref:Ubiquitin-like domain-containing protein n=1 Tax=Kwoniella pini CBS 10737 TaxID=1296096 RepID=A0A1B9I827_9TREE|nr:uncharacterized protein I206_02402 [Kwoniella pini CBS 10737]OCF51687.1 hypothetical protein I206_02402 [Kwoniella pini CBS 10737]
MSSNKSPKESEPLLPIHHIPIPNSSSSSSSNTSQTPTRSRLSTRKYIPISSSINSKDKGKGKLKEEDLESGLSEIELKNEINEINLNNKSIKEKGRNIIIIFSNESELTGNGNLQCWIENYENVGNLKEQIKTLRPSLENYNLRLIHSGRLLTDGILLLPWLKSLEERVKRQAAGVGGDVENILKDVGLTEDNFNSNDDLNKSKENGFKEKEQDKVWLHCIVGSKEEKTPSNEEEEPTVPRRRGFDVLLDAGLSADEVAAMRRQFYESRGEEVPEGMEGGDVNDEHARALEEQWIEGDLTAETATTTTEGLYTSILHGLLTGFLFPIIPWFFFREPPLPNFFDSEAEALIISRRTTNTSGEGSDANANLNESTRNEMSTTPTSPPSTTTTTNTNTNINTNTNSNSNLNSAQERFIRAGGIGIGLGEIVASQVFGKRMQMGILLGTILNIAFGALRFLN